MSDRNGYANPKNNKSRKTTPPKMYDAKTIKLGKSVSTYNNKKPFKPSKYPEYVYGLIGEVLPNYYIRNVTETLLKSENKSDRDAAVLAAALKRDKTAAIPLHDFVDLLIEKHDFCIDCYYDILENTNFPQVVEDKYQSFNKYFGHITALDPYTLEEINKQDDPANTSIEHIVPYSKTDMNIYLDADFQNLCYVNKSVNSLRRDHPISFDDKNPELTTSVFYDGAAHPYADFKKSKHAKRPLDEFSTLEKRPKGTYFLPPRRSYGFLGRRILYCILTYLDTNSDNFADLYWDFDFKRLLRILSNDYNMGFERFEFLYDDEIYFLQRNHNICLSNNYSIIKRVFSRSTHSHPIPTQSEGRD
jgi:hypothetical protein